jgi:hypothetical protein
LRFNKLSSAVCLVPGTCYGVVAGIALRSSVVTVTMPAALALAY